MDGDLLALTLFSYPHGESRMPFLTALWNLNIFLILSHVLLAIKIMSLICLMTVWLTLFSTFSPQSIFFLLCPASHAWAHWCTSRGATLQCPKFIFWLWSALLSGSQSALYSTAEEYCSLINKYSNWRHFSLLIVWHVAAMLSRSFPAEENY